MDEKMKKDLPQDELQNNVKEEDAIEPDLLPRRAKETAKMNIMKQENNEGDNDDEDDEDEDETLEEDFLLKAISAVQEGNTSDDEDGIDDIDIDFDEGDCNALIHQQKTEDEHPVYIIDENNQLQKEYTNSPSRSSFSESDTILKTEKNDIRRDSHDDSQVKPCLTERNDILENETDKDENIFSKQEQQQRRRFTIHYEQQPQKKFTIHYKPKGDSTKSKVSTQPAVRRHNFMCNCDSCQVLYETYNEFVGSSGEIISEEAETGPSPSKIPKETDMKNEMNGQTSLAHKCQTCGTILSSYKDYRTHLQNKHPRHWKTIQDFEEKRRIVMRKTAPKQIPSHGNFFKSELQRPTTQFPPLSEVLTVPQSSGSSNSPVTYFYPMLYPVYFVMDKNQQVKGNVGGIQQVPHLPAGAPFMFPSAPFPAAAPAPVPQTASMTINKTPVEQPTEKDQQYVCGNCGLTFSFKEHLVLHMRVHSDKPFKCESCGISFINNVELKRHYRTHTFSLNCEYCNDTFVSHDQLVEHENAVHNTDDNKVGVQKFDALITPVEGPKKQCKICDHIFDSYKGLEEHMLLHVHTGEAFPCYHCGISFTNNDSLQKHLKTHTKSPDTLEETIEEPGKVTMTVNKVYKEPYTIKSDKPKKYYFCDVCGANFVSTYSLNRHKRIHTGERTYKCEECSARFRTNSQRKAHILTHTGERPFKCHLCPATFIQQGNLKRHIWTHTGEKPHVCDICGSGFLSTSDLKRHIRIHTGERPYKCHLCTCSFTTSGNLKSHLKTHPEHSSVLDQVNGQVSKDSILSTINTVKKSEEPSETIQIKQEVMDEDGANAGFHNVDLTMVKVEEDSS